MNDHRHRTVTAMLFTPGSPVPAPALDQVANEAPLAVTINGQPVTVTMRTPGDDKQLAHGLVFGEGIITAPIAEVTAVEQQDDQGLTTSIDLQVPEDLVDLSRQRRSQISTSSCGLCGKSDLDALAFDADMVEPRGCLPLDSVGRLFQLMADNQDDYNCSGATHAAAAFSLSGRLLQTFEDIGRHNAVDKVVGALLAQEQLSDAVCVTVSSRVSYEIVTKIIRAGVQFICAVSAPTALAVDLAERYGVTVVGFCREGRCTAYSRVDALVADNTLASHPELRIIQ